MDNVESRGSVAAMGSEGGYGFYGPPARPQQGLLTGCVSEPMHVVRRVYVRGDATRSRMGPALILMLSLQLHYMSSHMD